MKHIFDDLGVQYTFQDGTKLLWEWLFPDEKAEQKLKEELESAFGGAVTLVNKGRDAIELGLRAIGAEHGRSVLTQAFSCAAIEEAILRTGATPVYADLDDETSTISVKTLEKAYKKADKPIAVIIQHTLGVSADIEAIVAWSAKHDLIVIEDLAQALGATSKSGEPLGMFGQQVILSFGRDKILDAASGGALILRDNAHRAALEKYLAEHPLGNPPWLIELKETFYPILTWKIRSTYSLGIGKALHFVSKKLNLMSSSTQSPTKTAAAFQSQFASLALRRWKNLDQQLAHRKKIASIYDKALRGSNVPTWMFQNDMLPFSSNIRFGFGVENPQALISFMNEHGVHIADRWYRSVVDCGSQTTCKTTYQSSSCPIAEQRAQTVVNLPTHRLITPEIAQRITKLLKDFYVV